MTKAISELTGGEDIVSSENIFRAKDAPGEVEESLGEDISELKEALLEGEGDCVRVWSKSLLPFPLKYKIDQFSFISYD